MRRPCRWLYAADRSVPSRVNPAFSATRSDALLCTSARNCTRSAPASIAQREISLSGRPVADLDVAEDGVDHVNRDRPHRLAGPHVDDREESSGAFAPGRLRRQHVLLRILFAVRARHLVDPPRDLRLVAGVRDRRHVVERPGTQRDETVGERRIGRSDVHDVTVLAPPRSAARVRYAVDPRGPGLTFSPLATMP